MDLRVPASAVATDALLEFGTCPLHDQVGVRTRKRTFFTATPVWVWVLALVSLLIGIIVMLLIRKRVVGSVAECAQCLAGRRRFRYTTIAAWVIVIGLLFVIAGSGSGALVALWFVAVAAVLVYSFVGNNGNHVRGVLSNDQLWVDLTKVAPTFASKVEARMAAATG